MTNKEVIMFLLILICIVSFVPEKGVVHHTSDLYQSATQRGQVARDNSLKNFAMGKSDVSNPPEKDSGSSVKQKVDGVVEGVSDKKDNMTKALTKPSTAANNANRFNAPAIISDTVTVYSLKPGATVGFNVRCGSKSNSYRVLGSEASITVPWSKNCSVQGETSTIGLSFA